MSEAVTRAWRRVSVSIAWRILGGISGGGGVMAQRRVEVRSLVRGVEVGWKWRGVVGRMKRRKGG